jgi:hypothetical protein
MAMKTSKNSLRRFVKNPLFVVGILLILACGPMLEPDEFVSFFQPQSSDTRPKEYGFFLSPNIIWGMYDYNSNDVSDSIENALAWKKYELSPMSESKENNTYLALAKAVSGEMIDLQKPVQSSKLAINLLHNYKQVPSAFLKERYAYLMVKEAFYNHQWAKAVSMYSLYLKPLSNKSFISDWAKLYVAGSKWHLKKTAEAYYDFAQVARNNKAKRHEAMSNIIYFDTIPLKDALKLCKTNQEKAAVYAFASIHRFVDALSYLEKIIELDPQNPLLEFLVAREINKNERTAMGAPLYPRGYLRDGKPFLPLANVLDKDVSSYFSRLRVFVDKCETQPHLAKSPFWKTASAYMAWIVNDFDAAKQKLQTARQMPTDNPWLRNQQLLQEMLLSASTMKTLTPEVENQWWEYLEKFQYVETHQQNFAFLKATQLMRNQYKTVVTPSKKRFWQTFNLSKPLAINNITAKLYLLAAAGSAQTKDKLDEKKFKNGNSDGLWPNANHSLYAIEDSASLRTIQAVARFVLKPLNEADRRLIRLSGLSKNDILSSLGMKLVEAQQYKQAAKVFVYVDSLYWAYSHWDYEKEKNVISDYFFRTQPFVIFSVVLADSLKKLTPTAFCQRMESFQTRTQQNPNDAEAWLGLAVGKYSISYFGDWHKLSRKGETSSYITNYQVDEQFGNEDMPTKRFAVWQKIDAQSNYHNLKQTIAHLQKVIATTKDRNVAAKAVYLLASIEIEKNGRDLYSDKKKEFENKLKKYYTQLNEKYRDTPFVQEVIGECIYLDNFIHNKDIITTSQYEPSAEIAPVIESYKPSPRTPLANIILLSMAAGLAVLMYWGTRQK